MDASLHVAENEEIEIKVVGPKKSYDDQPHVQIQTSIIKGTKRDMIYMSLFGEKAIWDYVAELNKVIETITVEMELWGEVKDNGTVVEEEGDLHLVDPN
jgi:hypothetical protein